MRMVCYQKMLILMLIVDINFFYDKNVYSRNLTYNDLMEVSASPKIIYYLSKRNKKFVEKMSHSRCIFSGATMFDHYKDICLSFVAQLSHALKDYFDDDTFFGQKKIFIDKFIFNMLPMCLIICSPVPEVIIVLIFVYFVRGLMLNKKKASYYIYKKLFLLIFFCR